MKKTELAKRRERMVDEIRRGKDTQTVAEHFHVAARTVRNACRKHGVPLSNTPSTLETTLLMLAEMERGEDHEVIARQFGKHHTRVRKLYRQAEAAGLAVRMPCNDFRGIRAPDPAKRPSESTCGPPTAKKTHQRA